jgi:hypothetical protein
MQVIMFDRQSIFIHGMKTVYSNTFLKLIFLAPVRLNSSGRR